MKEPSLDHVTTFKIGDKEYKSTLDDDLFVDQAHLTETYASHAKKFAFYATAYELALNHEARVKADMERAYALLDEQARTKLQVERGKFTEAMVEAMIITSDSYKQFQERYFEAQSQTGLLRAARDAMIHRKEMLVSLGANYRAEIHADTSLLMNQTKKTK